MKKRTFTAFLMIGGSIFGHVFAEPVPDTLNGTDSTKFAVSEKMLVTANRVESIIENPLLESRALQNTVSRVDRQDILDQKAHTVVEAIEYTPGVWIESRGRKVKQFVSYRGQKYPYPQYAVDGVWQREFLELPYFFSTRDIERIEIMRSSSAIINGVSGLTGIINIVPRNYDSIGVTAHTEYGSFNTWRAGMSHGNTIGSLMYAAGVGTNNTDGPVNKHAAEKGYNGFGRLKWSPTDKLEVKANIFGLYGSREFALAESPASPNIIKRMEKFDPYQTLIANVQGLYTHNDYMSSSLLTYFTHRDHDFINESGQSPVTTRELDYELGATFTQAFIPFERNIFRISMFYNNWVAPNGKRFYVGQPLDVHTFSVAIADKHDIGRFILDGGVRWSREYLKEFAAFGNEEPKGIDNITPLENEWNAPVIDGAMGITALLNKMVNVSFHGAAGMVTPRKGTLDINKETPKNEKRIKADCGIQVQPLALGSATLSGYTVVRNDAISITADTAMVNERIFELYRNVDKTTIGVELDMRSKRLFDIFELFTNVSLNRSRIDDGGTMVRDKESPEMIVSGGVSAKRFGLDFNVQTKYVSEYQNNRFAANKQMIDLGDYSVLDGSIGYTVTLNTTHKLHLYLAADNLLDSKYSTVAGYPDFGRRLSSGVTYNY